VKAETLLPLGKLDPGLAQPEAPLDLAAVPDDAAEVDALGYHALLMEETKDDPFQVLAVAAGATQRVQLGTSVAIAFARSPFVTAMAAWTLQKFSKGRFELGLGSQVRGHVRRRYGLEWHPPGPWMRDYVGAVRAIWKSWQRREPLDFESDRYRLDLNVPLFTPAPIEHPDIPIHVAAVNPIMCRVAAQVADGVRLHPVCSPTYIAEVVHPAVRAGRRESSGAFDICLKPLIATGPDEETLRLRTEVARQRLAFYVSTPAYRGAFDHLGLSDLADELAQLSKRGQWDAMASRIGDDVLSHWVTIARYDELADRLLERFGALIDRVEVSIPLERPSDRAVLRDAVKRLSEAPPRSPAAL
jgi:probable F420-dependent oxidoreductase